MFMEFCNQIIKGLHSMSGGIKVLKQDKTQQLASTVSESKTVLLMGRGY